MSRDFVVAMNRLAGGPSFWHGLCMSKASARWRRIHSPAKTAGELLDAYENESPPKVKTWVLKRLLNQRGRRSGGHK